MSIQPGSYVSRNVRLVRLLGTGGMGSVWVAHHEGLDSEVAVKFVSIQLAAEDPTVLPRFQREAALSAKIKSPHVVKTFDHGITPGGQPYIVMELLDGVTLGDRLTKDGRLTPHDTANIVTQVAQVLAEAHQLGVVHRDIKPDNVFLLESAYDMFVKVLDFGIAKQTIQGVSSVTDTGTIVGTPEYMSPEQLLSTKSADYRSDMWSLAVLAYHCLTGLVPFRGETLPSLSIEICSGRYLPPSMRMPELGRQFDAWFARALEPEPDKRFQSVLEMADTFRNICRGSPTIYGRSSDKQPLSSVVVSSEQSITGPRPPGSGTQVSDAPPPGGGTPRPFIGVERARVDSGIQPYVQAASADESGRRMAIGATAPSVGSPTMSGASSTLEPPKAVRRGAWVVLGVLLAACAALAFGAVSVLRRGGFAGTTETAATAGQDKAAAGATTAAATDAPVTPGATASSSAGNGEPGGAGSVAASSSAVAAPRMQKGPPYRLPQARSVGPKLPPPPPPKSGCANPYVMQPDGSLKVKPECL